jgi:hypothetical protein
MSKDFFSPDTLVLRLYGNVLAREFHPASPILGEYITREDKIQVGWDWEGASALSFALVITYQMNLNNRLLVSRHY